MADHVLSIEFTGEFAKLRTQVENEAQQIRQKIGTVPIGSSQAAQENAAGAQALSGIIRPARPITAYDRREVEPLARAGQYDSLTFAQREAVADQALRTGKRFGNLTESQHQALVDRAINRSGRTTSALADRSSSDSVAARVDRSFDNADFAQFKQEERAVRKANSDVARAEARLARQKQRDEDSDDGPGFRLGRIGQFATAAFVARDAFHAAANELTYRREIVLAGSDTNAQLAAENSRNEGLALTGEIGSSAADFVQSKFIGRDVSRLGTALVQQSAANTDQRTQLILQNRLRLASATFAADSAAAPNEFDRARLQSSYQSNVSAGEIKVRREEAANQAEKDATTRKNELASSFDQRFLSLYSSRIGNRDSQLDGQGPLIDQRQRFVDRLRQELQAKDAADVADVRSRALGPADAQKKSEDEQNERLRTAQLAGIDRASRAYDIRLTGSTRSNILSGQNDAFGARLSSLQSDTSANVAENSNDPIRATKLFLEGYSKTFAFIGDTGRQLRRATDDAQSSTRQNQELLQGNTLAAARIGIESERVKALRELPDNFIYNNILGGNKLRDAINANATSSDALATKNINNELQSNADQYQTALDVSNYTAQRKPYTARAAEIADTAQAQARALYRTGGPFSAANRRALLQTAINNETSLQNDIAYSGSAQVVASGSTGSRQAFNSDPGNPDANEAIQKSADESTRMRQLMEGSILFDPTLGTRY